MNVIDLAEQAKAEVTTTTEQDGFENPEYIVTVWAFEQHQLQKFADLVRDEKIAHLEAKFHIAFEALEVTMNLLPRTSVASEIITEALNKMKE